MRIFIASKNNMNLCLYMPSMCHTKSYLLSLLIQLCQQITEWLLPKRNVQAQCRALKIQPAYLLTAEPGKWFEREKVPGVVRPRSQGCRALTRMKESRASQERGGNEWHTTWYVEGTEGAVSKAAAEEVTMGQWMRTGWTGPPVPAEEPNSAGWEGRGRAFCPSGERLVVLWAADVKDNFEGHKTGDRETRWVLICRCS